MKLIIDAYNILKQISSHQYVTEKERTQFVKQVVTYADKKDISIIVVFDGVSESQRASIEQLHTVTIVYAGPRMQADIFIQKYIAKFKEHEFLLVSSDRELCKSVVSYKVQSIDALPFYTLLQESNRRIDPTVSGNQKATKLDSSSGTNSLDILMEEAANESMVKDSMAYEESTQRASVSYMPSKKERALLKKIKKL